LNRLPRLGPPPGAEGRDAVRFEAGGRGGRQVIVAKDVKIAFGERVLLEDFTNISPARRGDPAWWARTHRESTLLKATPARGRSKAAACGCPIRSPAGYYPARTWARCRRTMTLFDIIYDLRTQWKRAARCRPHLGKFGFSGDGRAAQGRSRSRAGSWPGLSGDAGWSEPTNTHLDVESIEELERDRRVRRHR